MDKRFIEDLNHWIAAEQGAMIADLTRLVRIKSVSTDPSGDKPFGEGPAKALDEALAIGRRLGFETENYDYYAGSIRFGNKPEIGMLAHIDVVPEGKNWTSDPYDVTVKDGFLFGRGVGDDKGPAIMALYAMKFFKEKQLPLKYGLRLVLGCDEETGKGFRDMEHFLKVAEAPLFSLVPDASFPCCNGEKGILVGEFISESFDDGLVSFQGGQVHNMVPDYAEAVLANIDLPQAQQALQGSELKAEAHPKGILFSATGTACHAAGPFQAISAVERLAAGLLKAGLVEGKTAKMMQFIADIQSDFIGTAAGVAASDNISTPLTLVIGVAKTEDKKLHLSLNLRYPTTATAEPIIEKLSAFAKGYNFILHDPVDSRPLYYPPDHPAIVTLVKTFREVTGMDAQPKVIGGGTYARAIPRAVSFGAGFPALPDAPPLFPEGHGGAHQPDEAWSLRDMADCLKIYVLTLLRLNELPLEDLMK